MTYIAAEKIFAYPERLAGWARGERPAPITVEWDLSNRCNLGCRGCHFAHTHTRGPLASQDKPAWFASTGDLAEMGVVTRGLAEMAAAGVEAVVWSGGGEPVLHPAFASAVYGAAAVGLKQGLYTDGVLIRPAHRPALERLSWAVVSLDAANREHYQRYKQVDAFDQALAGAIQLVDAGVTVGASFLLSGETWREAWQMLGLARAIGVTYTTFRPLVTVDPEAPATLRDHRWPDTAGCREELEWLAAQPDVEISLARFAAYAGWSSDRGYPACYGIRFASTVTPDGRVWVCPNRRGMAESALGNLSTESFAAIWARHPGAWRDFSSCRAMCRSHFVNQAAAVVFERPQHAEFV